MSKYCSTLGKTTNFYRDVKRKKSILDLVVVVDVVIYLNVCNFSIPGNFVRPKDLLYY